MSCTDGCDCKRTVVSTRAPEGTVGPVGVVGAAGADGDQGIDGNQGVVGNVGVVGNQGPVGDAGPTGPVGSGFNNPWLEHSLTATDFDIVAPSVTIDSVDPESMYYYKVEGNAMIIGLNINLFLSSTGGVGLLMFMKAPPGVNINFTNAIKFNVPWAAENDISETSPISMTFNQIVPRNAVPGGPSSFPDRELSCFLPIMGNSAHFRFYHQVVVEITP